MVEKSGHPARPCRHVPFQPAFCAGSRLVQTFNNTSTKHVDITGSGGDTSVTGSQKALPQQAIFTPHPMFSPDRKIIQRRHVGPRVRRTPDTLAYRESGSDNRRGLTKAIMCRACQYYVRTGAHGTLSPLSALSCWRFQTLYAGAFVVRRTRGATCLRCTSLLSGEDAGYGVNIACCGFES